MFSTLSVAPDFASYNAFTAWYKDVVENHRGCILLELTEWDNCFGNLYAGSTPSHPKFWSYITQHIQTDTDQIEINTCISVALINTSDKVEIDYLFENNNSSHILINGEDLKNKLSLCKSMHEDILKFASQLTPELQGLKEMLERYMNRNNYPARWRENII